MSSARAPMNPPSVNHRWTESFDGTLIHYDLYDAPSAAAVIVVPGFWRDRRHPSMQRIARRLSAEGHRVAVVDLRGHGESGGTYGFNLHEHYDVAAVAEDLLAQASTVATIALLGLSYGGAISISVAARHDLPISAIVLISAVADFEMIRPRMNPFAIHRHIALAQALKRPRFVWRARPAAKIRALDEVGRVHVPLCLIHVENDWLINHQHSIALYAAANEPKELHLLDVPGNYHADRIFNAAAGRVEPIVTSFLHRHVDDPTPRT